MAGTSISSAINDNFFNVLMKKNLMRYCWLQNAAYGQECRPQPVALLLNKKLSKPDVNITIVASLLCQAHLLEPSPVAAETAPPIIEMQEGMNLHHLLTRALRPHHPGHRLHQ